MADQTFTPNMDPPADGITPAVFTMPTEPVDAGNDHSPAGEGLVGEVLHKVMPHVTRLKREAKQRLALTGPMKVAGASPFITRAQWGARQPTSAYLKMPAGCSVTFHYEGPTMGAYDHARCPGIVQGIQAYHMDHNGWIDIAYNLLVCIHGSIYEGRGYWNRSAANGTNASNGSSYAVCFIAGVGDPLSDAAKAGLLDARLLMTQHAGASEETHVHSDWFATACPGDIVRNWVRAGLAPPAGYSPAPSPIAPQPSPNGGVVLTTALPDAIGFIDDPTSDGGWLVTKSGGIYTKAPSNFYGSLGGIQLNAPIAAFLPTPTGKGYWLFGEDGGVFAFGDAPFNGTYAKFADEYKAGIHRVAGAYFRGNPSDPSSWRYSWVSNRLESYDI
jgi:hypothetical protein